MRGLNLRSFGLDLQKIKPDSEEPVHTISRIQEKLGPWLEKVERWWEGEFDFLKEYHRLPLKAFEKFSFDELCKLKHSSFFMMDEAIENLFETRVQYEIVRKITSSMWRWGTSRSTWNQIVDAYDNIRRFTLVDDPHFTVRLHYTTGSNAYSYSKFERRVYLDGVFAFFIYYKNTHVLTIGFSVLEGRRLLIQQVQSAQRSGNRYLFKLPPNRLEFAIDVFLKNFPGYKLYVVDGNLLAEKNLAGYRKSLAGSRKFCQESKGSSLFSVEYLRSVEEACEQTEKGIEHLEADKYRLAAFYQNAGRHQLDTSSLFTAFGLTHYEVRS
jgi:hypothetical protein